MALLLQLLANGLVAGSSWAMVALGFGLIFRVTGTFHFAHGSVYAAAGYFAYSGVADLGLPWGIAFPLAAAGAVLLGCSIEVWIYRPLRRLEAPPLALLVSSLGVAVFLNNLLGLVWSYQSRNLPTAAGTGYVLGPVDLSSFQVATVGVGLIVTIGLIIYMKYSSLGLTMRALASTPFMARIVGIPAERVTVLTFAVGSLVAAPAGILTMLDTGVLPDMGTSAVLMATIAVFVGGIASLPGAALAAGLLGLLVNVGIWQWSARWQNAIAFSLLLLFMVCRPRGLFGLKQRQVKV